MAKAATPTWFRASDDIASATLQGAAQELLRLSRALARSREHGVRAAAAATAAAAAAQEEASAAQGARAAALERAYSLAAQLEAAHQGHERRFMARSSAAACSLVLVLHYT